jgi:hypothetical protein
MLSLTVVIATALFAQPALASCPPRETAQELARREDVAVTGAVSSFVPLGFIFAADRVYKGDVPAHVLVLGQYRPPDLLGTRLFAVMRYHLPGVYSMASCDGQPLPDQSLSSLGEGRAPSADIPVLQVAVGVVVVLLLLLLGRRGRGKPATPATAAAY